MYMSWGLVEQLATSLNKGVEKRRKGGGGGWGGRGCGLVNVAKLFWNCGGVSPGAISPSV